MGHRHEHAIWGRLYPATHIINQNAHENRGGEEGEIDFGCATNNALNLFPVISQVTWVNLELSQC
jgi:hypothetical protein